MHKLSTEVKAKYEKSPLRIKAKQVLYLTKSNPLDAGLILTSRFVDCVGRSQETKASGTD